MVRSIIRKLGNIYQENQLIEKEEDIFYLTLEEIFSKKPINYKERIQERKEDYSIFQELPNYSRLIFEDKEFDKHHIRINSIPKKIKKNTLEGIPTSSGIVEGVALVINNIQEKIDTKDKILITKMTDPGWVFLLANAKGMISEKGSLLSHTAIISRELKIPSIVGVENATNTIETGDIVKMNANTGKIEIIKKENI